MTRKKDFSVSVIGGGIGGLSLVIGLSRAGIAVDIFEAAPQFAEIGAGISFGANARTALIKLGLGEEFDEQSTQIPSTIYFEWRKGEGNDQKLISEVLSSPVGNSSVHRAKFLDAMVKHIPKDISHFGKRLIKIEDLPKDSLHRYKLHFEDESTHETDLVFGCDGIHSKVRDHINICNSKKPATLQWSGTWAYRGLIPTQKFKNAVGGERGEHYAKTPQMFVGKDRHVLIFPIDKFETVNAVAFATDRSQWPKRPNLAPDEPWTQPSSKEDMLSQFKGWGKDIISILECMDIPSKWALHQLIPSLDSYVHGNVAITGDAAHGGTPHQGAMAGQAIEDALFLTRLLSHPSIKASNTHEALQVYNKVRLPRANKVLETSLEAGDVYEYAGTPGSDEVKLKENVESRFNWIWKHDFDAEFEQAVEELKARGIA